MIARAGYYWTVGRPDYAQYAGALTLPDTSLPSTPNNQISVNNPAIKAWSAQSAKVSLEYYFEGVGLLSVGAFYREIEDSFANTVTSGTPEFLGLYGLDPAVYGVYDVSTQTNLDSTARMTGIDVNYKQALTFLPTWARGVQVFANASSLRAVGDAAANFAGFVPRTVNGGVSFTREKYNVRARWNYTGRNRRALLSGRGIEAGTYNWGSKRMLFDLSGEYQLRRNVTLFANLSNLTDAPLDVEIHGPRRPSTPSFVSGKPSARCGRSTSKVHFEPAATCALRASTRGSRLEYAKTPKKCRIVHGHWRPNMALCQPLDMFCRSGGTGSSLPSA